ncbi:hypothetical protein ACN28S_22880 [Cystobacter fuscus]
MFLLERLERGQLGQEGKLHEAKKDTSTTFPGSVRQFQGAGPTAGSHSARR